MFIQRYINEQAKILSLSTLKKLYQLIRLVLSYAYKKRDISIDTVKAWDRGRRKPDKLKEKLIIKELERIKKQ